MGFAHELRGTNKRIRMYSQKSVTVVGTLEASITGTGFDVYGAGVDGDSSGINANSGLFPTSPRSLVSRVEYEVNLFGRAPRKLSAIIKRRGQRDLRLEQKAPTYSKKINGYELRFDSPDVRLPSKKNFILTTNLPNSKAPVDVLSCGKMAKGMYRFVIYPPLSLTQGFGILLSAFHKKALVA
uniref:Tubby C-terminal domain-containing protein n=1 Tax=Lotharella oceanica TaxID=641309 RepID=A0A7S2XCB4_9EUKA|mmetsp:Transcript_28546/g.53508  ORF Transcript_28546/g.53508 Transcript_28546/m.53508 type:complete len:183 (+) Transcript_28546:178-726(+)